jgi:hypothetical protein
MLTNIASKYFVKGSDKKNGFLHCQRVGTLSDYITLGFTLILFYHFSQFNLGLEDGYLRVPPKDTSYIRSVFSEWIPHLFVLCPLIRIRRIELTVAQSFVMVTQKMLDLPYTALG